jgi:glutaredoxin-related protein
MDELEFFDLTKDKDIEGNLKQYSNYGDVPQLYINFQLLGGVEIIEALD